MWICRRRLAERIGRLPCSLSRAIRQSPAARSRPSLGAFTASRDFRICPSSGTTLSSPSTLELAPAPPPARCGYGQQRHDHRQPHRHQHAHQNLPPPSPLLSPVPGSLTLNANSTEIWLPAARRRSGVTLTNASGHDPAAQASPSRSPIRGFHLLRQQPERPLLVPIQFTNSGGSMSPATPRSRSPTA